MPPLAPHLTYYRGLCMISPQHIYAYRVYTFAAGYAAVRGFRLPGLYFDDKVDVTDHRGLPARYARREQLGNNGLVSG